MLQTYLVNILLFCGILLLIAFIVIAVQIVIVMLDVRRMSNEVKKKIQVLTSIFDIVTLLIGGLGEAKKRVVRTVSPNDSTMVAFAAGLKKGLEVLFKRPAKKAGKEDSNG